ncbi:carbohydrate ABC transporter permease [Micromonospora sp. BRA006-A]|nr:carbohydrate ABC transporter permease [Micromonospora sp. BRA006-A]
MDDPAGLPDPWVWDNYYRVLTQSDFWRQAFNSAVVALGTTLGVVVLGMAAAFVLARYTFRGREGLYTFFTLGLLFPAGAAILPLYLMLRDLNLINSYYAVILPQVAFSLPLTIVILRPFLSAIPRELEDAAAIDGAGRLGFLWRIVLPLSRPAVVTVGILAFVASWNAFLLPLLVLGTSACTPCRWACRTSPASTPPTPRASSPSRRWRCCRRCCSSPWRRSRSWAASRARSRAERQRHQHNQWKGTP